VAVATQRRARATVSRRGSARARLPLAPGADGLGQVQLGMRHQAYGLAISSAIPINFGCGPC
jgi:hypothetical protein